MVIKVHIQELAEIKELQEATALITKVWQAENPPVPFTFVRALSQAGAQVLGGYVEGRMAGVAVGFLGRDAQGALLHSHVVGVDEPWRGTGVGRAIKFGQRDWCLERGIKRIAWTFDPLRVHNAYFNLGRLGAVGVSYHADFYGPMNDGFNRGIPTDRVLAHWDLAQDEPGPAPLAASSPGGTLLDIGDDGRPTSDAAAFRPGADVRLRVPPAPSADTPTVLRWRLALREAMEPLMHTGYRWTAAAADGTYVLTPPTEDSQHQGPTSPDRHRTTEATSNTKG